MYIQLTLDLLAAHLSGALNDGKRDAGGLSAMRFEGDRLLLIIARQDVPFVVLDAQGKLERRFELPKTALPFIASGGYFGVGNHRRIRYLKPLEDECPRDVFGSRQDFSHSQTRFPVREKASRPKRHDLSWGQHPARARIAGGGAVRTIRMREQHGENNEC